MGYLAIDHLNLIIITRQLYLFLIPANQTGSLDIIDLTNAAPVMLESKWPTLAKNFYFKKLIENNLIQYSYVCQHLAALCFLSKSIHLIFSIHTEHVTIKFLNESVINDQLVFSTNIYLFYNRNDFTPKRIECSTNNYSQTNWSHLSFTAIDQLPYYSPHRNDTENIFLPLDNSLYIIALKECHDQALMTENDNFSMTISNLFKCPIGISILINGFLFLFYFSF